RSSADRRAFLDLPYRHYAEDPHFVPPLRMDQANVLSPKKNPFFEHGAIELFLAERGGEVVGRVAAIENGQHLAKYDDGNGFFGFFEAVEDYGVAEGLLDAASAWLAARGLTGVRGPANPTMNDVAGLLVDGFDRPPSILLPYNKPYYESFLQRWGFERAMTMWAFYVHEAYINADRMARGAEIVRRRNPGVSVRSLDLSRFDDDVATAMEIYNVAWAENWGHVPYTREEALHLAKELKPVIEKDLFLIAEIDGTPVAFAASLPNLNRALKKLSNGRLLPTGLPKLLATVKAGGVYEIRMALMGILPEHRNLGLDALLIHQTIVNGRRDGYEAAELSWVLDSNQPLINALEKLGCARDKEYAMFEAAL
ncbi:MAG: GNAT family N-acetyltransferase, partial [Bacteroidota bacterium]